MEGEQALSSLMYARLVALNNPVFDFQACNYTEKNMSRSDKVGLCKIAEVKEWHHLVVHGPVRQRGCACERHVRRLGG